MEVVDSSDEDEVGGTAAAGGGAGPPDGTVLLFTIRPCNKKNKNASTIHSKTQVGKFHQLAILGTIF